MKVTDLFEAPISDFNLVGDWNKSSSFRHADDRKLLQNPKAVAKIRRKWGKTPVDFNMVFANTPGAAKYLETGVVAPEWITQKLPRVADQIKVDPYAVNVIFTNNTGTERAPMTAWIIAHRFGHAVERSIGKGGRNQFEEWNTIKEEIESTTAQILSGFYNREVPGRRTIYNYSEFSKHESLINAFFTAIGSFRSAREGELRNSAEFRFELLAQYITTGRIRFKPLPATFGFGKKVFGRSSHIASKHPSVTERDLDYWNTGLEHLASTLEIEFENLLHRLVGKILVM